MSRHVAAPPDVVWRLLVAVETWPEWGPSIVGVDLPTATIELGSRGTVRTLAGVPLPFEVTTFEPGSAWAWKVAGVPATDHHVRADGAGCVVTFGVPWWAPAYLAVCALALRRIERLALARQRS